MNLHVFRLSLVSHLCIYYCTQMLSKDDHFVPEPIGCCWVKKKVRAKWQNRKPHFRKTNDNSRNNKDNKKKRRPKRNSTHLILFLHTHTHTHNFTLPYFYREENNHYSWFTTNKVQVSHQYWINKLFTQHRLIHFLIYYEHNPLFTLNIHTTASLDLKCKYFFQHNHSL